MRYLDHSIDSAGRISVVMDNDGVRHRSVLTPGADLAGQPAEVATAAAEAWTPEILASWQQTMTASRLPEPSLAQARADALHTVELAAERARLAFVTPGAGMALTYEAKRREAEAILIDPSPQAVDYPLAAERAARQSVTLAEVATEWQARADAWLAAAVAIESERETAKAAIAAAADTDAVRAILAGLSWPEPA